MLVNQALGFVLWFLWLRFFVGWLYGWSQKWAAAISVRTARLRNLPVVRAFPAAIDRVWGGPGWGVTLLFAAVMCTFTNLIFFPSDFYFDFVREHRYGL